MPAPDATLRLPEPAPSVSVILPTLNEGERLEACLASLRAQDYPQNRVEILLADGGSSDDTLDIAQHFDCRVLAAPGTLAEAAKDQALRVATGDILAMVDADNTIVGDQWLRHAVGALIRHPEALGFESYYHFAPQDPALNRYLTGLMQISDPWARAAASKLKLVDRDLGGCELFKLPENGSYPTGANGFVFRRSLLPLLADDPFHEATFFPRLIRNGRRILLKDPRCQVHHAYVRGWRDFYRKKQRVAMHYLLRNEEISGAWDADLSSARRWLAMLFCASVLGPAVEGVYAAIRSRRLEWLLHPAASLLAVVATVIGAARSRLAGSKERKREISRRLKPPHSRDSGVNSSK